MAKRRSSRPEFTESGYPAGNKILRDYMAEMLAIGERHESIKAFNRGMEEVARKVEEIQRRQAKAAPCPCCHSPLN